MYENFGALKDLGVLTPNMCPHKCCWCWLQGPHCLEAKLSSFLFNNHLLLCHLQQRLIPFLVSSIYFSIFQNCITIGAKRDKELVQGDMA